MNDNQSAGERHFTDKGAALFLDALAQCAGVPVTDRHRQLVQGLVVALDDGCHTAPPTARRAVEEWLGEPMGEAEFAVSAVKRSASGVANFATPAP